KTKRAKASRLGVPPVVPIIVPPAPVAVTDCPAVPLPSSGTVGQSSFLTASRIAGLGHQRQVARLLQHSLDSALAEAGFIGNVADAQPVAAKDHHARHVSVG